MIFRSESLIFEIPSGDTSNIYCKIYSQIFEEKKLSGQFGLVVKHQLANSEVTGEK